MARYHGSNAPGTSTETYGKGGQAAACTRNPNDEAELNGAPEGPFSHKMGLTGDGGMQGEESASKNGNSFHFK